MSEAVLRILLVEDNPGDADLLREALSLLDEPLEMTHVECLAQVAECLKRGGPFDAVLLDLGLPDSTGMATLEQANRAAPHLPIIVLTGVEDEALGIEAVRKGAQDYLVKGQNRPRALLRAIHHAIERKQIRDALLRAKEDWERTFDTVPDLIAILDGDHHITRVNRAMARALGMEPDQCIGLRCFECVHGTDGPPESCPHTCTLADGREHMTEVYEDRLGGDFLVTTTPMLGPDGELIGSVHVARDITAMKRAETELKTLNETLEQRVAERTAVAHRHAWHLRRLAAELSQVEHRERSRLAAILHDNLQQLLLAARLRLAGIGDDKKRLRSEVEAVDRLLDESMSASRDLSMELSPPILHRGTLGEVLAWLGGWFSEKHGLSVLVDVPEETPVMQEHVRVFLFHAVRELLLNAVKHSGTMEAQIHLFSADGRLHVQVEDRGAAFDPEAVQRKLDRAQSFGLLNIRERIEALEGRLEFERTRAGGACFRLVVPISATTGPASQ
jgi:PAS domain S-box-containing protein